MECLRTFERWARHEELLPYVRVLESWDDKVCEEWDPPDDNYLNCEDWLQDKEVYQNHKKELCESIEFAFSKADDFY